MNRRGQAHLNGRSIALLVSVALVCAIGMPGSAQAAWWPFSSSDSSAKSSSSKQRSAGKSTKTASKSSHSSSVVSSVTSGTKKVLTSPAAMFSGDKKSSPAKTPAKATKKTQPGKKGEKPGWFKSMFVKEESPPPKSVNEWMSLPRNDPWKTTKKNDK